MTWLLVITFDAIEPTPVAGPSDLVALWPWSCNRRGRSVTGGVDRGIEVGGESGVHDGGMGWEDKTNQKFIQTSFIRLQMAAGTLIRNFPLDYSRT